MTSIRHRLLAWLLTGMLVAVALAGIRAYIQALAEANELSDYHLRQVVRLLPGGAFGPMPRWRDPTSETGDNLIVQIWDRSGVQLYLSQAGPHRPQRAELGFSTVSGPSGEWRIYSAFDGDNVIQVAQPMSERRKLAAGMALRTVFPLLLLLPVLGVLIWFTVGRGLKPLDQIAAALGRRTSSSLQALPEQGLPLEVRPLVEALNGLLLRLGTALEAQRTFVADAAHELRTPLTAVQLQIQLAERATSDEERSSAFAELKRGLRRATRLVHQLLTLARQEPESAERLHLPVDLAEISRQVLAEHAPAAAERNIDLGIDAGKPVMVQGDREALRVLVGNLVDNAIRYGPEGARVNIALRDGPEAPRLDVTDDGPGISAAERTRVFDRFYRVAGTGADGSGLGLAIVKNIAERHGATVELADAQPGLRVSVTFPREPQPSRG